MLPKKRSAFSADLVKLVIFSVDFEVTLRMRTGGTKLRSLRANH